MKHLSVALLCILALCGAAPQRLEDYSGTYRNDAAGITYTVTQTGGQLYAQIAGQPQAEIYPSRWPDHFYYKVVPAYMEFVRQNQRVVGLILTQGGQHIPVYKIDASGKPMATSLTPAYPAAIALEHSALQEYAGTYDLSGTNIAVTVRDGHVFAQLTGQPAYEIFPSAKDEFYFKIVDAQISFTRTGGKVTGLVLHQNGRDTPAPRK